MKQQSRRSTFARSSSVNNYDAREIAIRFNKSVAKAVEEAHQEELHKKIEEEVTQRLTTQFTRQLAEKEATLEQKLQKQLKKSLSKVDCICNFITRQQAGTSSTVPPDFSPFEEQPDEDEEDDTTNLGDDSNM